MKDRIVEYPNRYIDQNGNVLTLTPHPGVVTEEGTPINKANLLSDETAELYGLTENDAIPDMALKKAIDLSSYIAFCANVNINSLDAAFGRNNEDRIKRIGLQLAMYAWFKGANKAECPFTELIKVDTISDIFNNNDARQELCANSDLMTLVETSPYAYSYYVLNYLNGFLSTPFSRLCDLLQDPIAMGVIYNNYATIEASGVLTKNSFITYATEYADTVEVLIVRSSTGTVYAKKCYCLKIRTEVNVDYTAGATASGGGLPVRWNSSFAAVNRFCSSITKTNTSSGSGTLRHTAVIIKCEP